MRQQPDLSSVGQLEVQFGDVPFNPVAPQRCRRVQRGPKLGTSLFDWLLFGLLRQQLGRLQGRGWVTLVRA